MRGKILNTESATLTRMIGSVNGRDKGNTEIKAIVSAVGAGFGPDFKVEEMRYGAVAILVDADVDGAHIRTLLHTLFWRHMKPLVQAGKLYIAQAPLYQLRKNKQVSYAYSDEERDRLLAKWGREGVTIQRYKGLGEMNPEQLRETVFSVGENGPFNEHLVQVVVEDSHRANVSMATLMGSQVAPRREWLLKTWAGEDSAWHNGDDDSEEEL
jgi:DNA gyrase subunit B